MRVGGRRFLYKMGLDYFCKALIVDFCWEALLEVQKQNASPLS